MPVESGLQIDPLISHRSHIDSLAGLSRSYDGGLELETIAEELGPVNVAFHRHLERQEDFRLLVLQPPSEQSSKIVCELQHVSFHGNLYYEALSYVWGYAIEPQIILLDDQPFKVTENLYSALWHLRGHSPRVLWVDALCIDQENPEEKTNQVQLMRRIYSCCHTDIVWLGPGEPYLELGWSTVAGLKRADIELMRDEYKKLGMHLNYREVGQYFSAHQWSALQGLFLDGPWNRVWIMQELACAPKIVLMLGDKTMDWSIISDLLDHDQFPDAYHSAFGHARYEFNIDRTFCQVQLVHYQRELTQGISNGPSGILDVLSRFKSTGASDPRDKIYALADLATTGPKFTVDYSKPVKEVYVDFFAQYIDFSQNLDLLCQSPWGFPELRGKPYEPLRRKDPSALPSWCPNFDSPGKDRLLFAQRGLFCAGAPTYPTPCRITNHSKLTLPGICLGGIMEDGTSGTYRGASLLRREIRNAELLDRSAASIVWPDQPERPYAPTGEPHPLAFSRTLIADCAAFPIVRLEPDERLTWQSHLEAWYHDSDVEENTYLSGHPADRILQTMHENWRFTRSDRRFFCMVPTAAIDRDLIVVFPGAKVPVVLRPWGEAAAGIAEYCVVGTAYVHGFMNEEAGKWVESGRRRRRNLYWFEWCQGEGKCCFFMNAARVGPGYLFDTDRKLG